MLAEAMSRRRRGKTPGPRGGARLVQRELERVAEGTGAVVLLEAASGMGKVDCWPRSRASLAASGSGSARPPPSRASRRDSPDSWRRCSTGQNHSSTGGASGPSRPARTTVLAAPRPRVAPRTRGARVAPRDRHRRRTVGGQWNGRGAAHAPRSLAGLPIALANGVPSLAGVGAGGEHDRSSQAPRRHCGHARTAR